MQDQKTQLDIFCKNLTYLRKYNGISKKKMATILRIGIKSLNQIEQGVMPPRVGIDILFYTAKYFSVRISRLLTEELQKVSD